MRQFRHIVALGMLVTFSAAISAPTRSMANELTPTVQQLQAALLYQFAKYVEWPADFMPESGGIIFGVLGAGDFRRDLAKIVSQRSIGGEKIVVRVFQEVHELEPTHVLFISAAQQENFRTALRKLQGASVLTVSDSEEFIESGGMISFVTKGKMVRFKINAKAVSKTRLELSSELKGLADLVVE